MREFIIPTPIMDIINKYPNEIIPLFCEFYQALIYSVLSEKKLSTVYWIQKCPSIEFMQIFIEQLSEIGIVDSIVRSNYAEITMRKDFFMLAYSIKSDEEFKQLQYDCKYYKYKLFYEEKSYNNLVKLDNQYQESGIIRNGFARAGKMKFQYDTDMIAKYAEYIAKVIFNEMDSTTKEIKYEDIIKDLVMEYAMEKGYYYNIGYNISDSRGRAIFSCTSKIFNPISNKTARACLKIKPNKLRNYVAVYAFISELLGYKGKTAKDKVLYGKKAYQDKILPSLNDMITNNDYSDLYVLIWLERIYDSLDNNTNRWDIPIELDATASLTQVMSVLLNYHEGMDLTNLTNPTELKDMWNITGVPRKLVKEACTPRLYGSNAYPKELWIKAKLEYTQEQVNIIMEEITNGRFRLFNKFKNFIINNVKPKSNMTVNINNETFKIVCNKKNWTAKPVIEEYEIFCSNVMQYKKVRIEVQREDDLEQFKRYFVTLLIHNLDSQVADYIAGCKELDWIIPNHDSFTIHPNDSGLVRRLYIDKMYNIYRNREKILKEYFDSIGINIKLNINKEEVKSFSGLCLK